MAEDTDKAGENGPEDVIDAGKAQGGRTATGQEADRRAGIESDRTDSQESRGGPEQDEEIKPDFPPHEGVKPIGMQAEAAKFVANGSIPVNHVGSNSGLVPVSAFATSPEDAKARMEAQAKADRASSTSSRRRLTDAEIDKHSSAELRAVATDRGYKDFSNSAGTRGTRAMFRQAQADDKTLDKD